MGRSLGQLWALEGAQEVGVGGDGANQSREGGEGGRGPGRG